MLERKEAEVGLEASAARSWVEVGVYAFRLIKSRLWAEFGRIILYDNVKACFLPVTLNS